MSRTAFATVLQGFSVLLADGGGRVTKFGLSTMLRAADLFDTDPHASARLAELVIRWDKLGDKIRAAENADEDVRHACEAEQDALVRQMDELAGGAA